MAKVSVPFSLDETHVNFIRSFRSGTNLSENLRAILNAAQADSVDLVRYDEATIAKQDFTPAYQNPTAFLLFQKGQGVVEYGSNLPFKAHKKITPGDLGNLAEEAGYRTQCFESKQHGFIAIWAAPGIKEEKSKCVDCKAKLRMGFDELVEKIC